MNLRKSLLGIFSTMAISLLTLVLFLWLAYQRSLETKMRTDAVEHTYQVRLMTKDLVEAMLNIETGNRGYSIIHDRVYLKPFDEGSKKIKDIQSNLRKLVQDNPLQLKRLDTLDKFVDLKIKLIQANVDNISKGKGADTTLLKDGRRAMDEIRGITNRFLLMEEGIQIEGEKNQLEADRNLRIYSSIFSFLALFFLLIFSN